MRRYIFADTVSFDDESRETQIALAKDPNTRPNTLAKLAEYNDFNIRRAIALNPNTPVEILRKMSRSEDLWNSVAKNPNTPEDILRYLGSPYGPTGNQVKIIVAQHKNTPVDVLVDLAENCLNDYVRLAAISNSKIPVDVRDRVAKLVGYEIGYTFNCETGSDLDYYDQKAISAAVRKTLEWYNYDIPTCWVEEDVQEYQYPDEPDGDSEWHGFNLNVTCTSTFTDDDVDKFGKIVIARLTELGYEVYDWGFDYVT